eukprot:1136971-Pelagomonas_calceolata.AAC.3
MHSFALGLQMSEHPWFLQNLPPDALSMNHNFLNHANFTGVQTVEEIQAILRMAQTPGPGKPCWHICVEGLAGTIARKGLCGNGVKEDGAGESKSMTAGALESHE